MNEEMVAQTETENPALNQKNTKKPAKKTNPFSHENVKKAKTKLGRPVNSFSVASSLELSEEDRLYTYLKFDPNGITGELLKKLEADTAIRILAFPFANGEVYGDDFALDETKAKDLEDGNLYAVLPKANPLRSELMNGEGLNTQELDELYLPNEEDTALQFQAFREAGFTEPQIDAMRICLFVRPTGFVRYLDQETGTRRAAPGMQVWGLVFGIPLHTYSDDNGHYRFPWRFVAGTIMGTHAKNDRVNIKPFNTQGAWWLTIPLQFVVGSVHIEGWVTACNMRRGFDINFDTHRQGRLWAQLMHATLLHDEYTANDGIPSAPDRMTVYAHWSDTYGQASAPMLGHLPGSAASIGIQYLASLLGGADPNNYPNLFNLLTGLLPDMTIKVGDFEQNAYSSRLMQTAFHELAHASHYRRVGNSFWVAVITRAIEVQFSSNPCGGYGCGTDNADQRVALTESWAEFLGTSHALRHHPNGRKFSQWFGGLLRFDVALEQERWFTNAWIPSGIYNDFIDQVNTAPEAWDGIGGLTISDLYEVFGPSVTTVCGYHGELVTRFPQIIIPDSEPIFAIHNYGGCL